MKWPKDGIIPRSTLGIRLLPGSPRPRQDPQKEGVARVNEKPLSQGVPVDEFNKPGRSWIFVRRTEALEDLD